MRVARVAFDAYQRRLRHSETPATPTPKPNIDVDLLNAEFERETGLTPRTWERRWKAGEIEDSAENMRLAIRALTLNLAKQHKPADRQGTTAGKPREAIHARYTGGTGFAASARKRRRSRAWTRARQTSKTPAKAHPPPGKTREKNTQTRPHPKKTPQPPQPEVTSALDGYLPGHRRSPLPGFASVR